MSAGKISLIYIVALGFAAFFNFQLPSQASMFVDLFIPVKIDLVTQDFIRYRMVLFLTSTIVLLVLAPVIAYLGTPEFNREKFEKIHWINFIVVILVIPVGWISYPLIALCVTCWTSNDIFYFALTVIFFVALQIFVQAIALKLKLGKVK